MKAQERYLTGVVYSMCRVDLSRYPGPGRYSTSCCRRARREAVGDVRVLVQPYPAAAALLEEGARDAPVRGAADASAPAAFRVRGDVRELELDVYLVPAPEGLPLLVADVEPLLRLPAGDDVLRKLTHLLTSLEARAVTRAKGRLGDRPPQGLSNYPTRDNG